MTDESLFIAALELPSPADRQAFLDTACAGDPARRQRLDQLLARPDRRGVTRGCGGDTKLS